MRKIYFLSFCCLFFLHVAVAQQATKLISANFQQATVGQFVNELESKSNFHFYYDQKPFDSLRVTLQVDAKPLETILDLVFKNTDFHYAITDNKVFLTRGRQIKTELAAGFSEPLNGAPVIAQTNTVADYTADQDKTVPQATTENKVYEIGIKTNTIIPGNSTLSGYIRDIKSGEAAGGRKYLCCQYTNGCSNRSVWILYHLFTTGQARIKRSRNWDARYQKANYSLC